MKKVKKCFCFVLAIVMLLCILPINAVTLPVKASSEKWLWPVAGVYSMSRGYYSGHSGIDVWSSTIAGKEVRAAKSGTIEISMNNCSHTSFGNNRCSCNGGCGNYVQIRHSDGTISRYLHLKQHTAHNTGYVNQGDVIGQVWSSGDSSGYHLHFDIWENGVRINSNPIDARHTYSGAHDAGNIQYIYDLNSNSWIKDSFDCHCIVEVTENNKGIMNMPCSKETDPKSEKIESVNKGSNYRYEAIELILNTKNNYWYKVITKSGKTGYIYAGNVEWVDHKTTDITGPGISVPANHTQGKAYPLSGSVTASNSELTKVSVYIYPGTKTSGTSETGYSQSVSGKSFTLGGSAIDSNTVFNILGEGQHTYVVTASCKYHYATSGTTKGMKTVDNIRVYTQTFNVVSSHSHSYSSHYEADHPHRVYNKCSCGDWYYTGATTSVSSCSQCNPAESSTIIYPTNGGIYKIASGVGNNMYLDFACTSNNVQIYENCDGHSDPAFVISQYFRLTHVGDGWYTIINIGNGKCADIENTNPASGINIMQWDCYPNDGQLYRFYDAGNGYCYIKSKLGTYVDVQNGYNVNNTNVWTYTFNGSNAQQWQLISHKHSYTSKVIEPATCTKNGVKEYTCSGCLTSYRENIPAKGHSFGKWLPILFLSNTNEVKQAQTCSTCNHVQEQTVSVMMGDINGDRQVSVADARLVLRKAVGLESFSEVQTKLADVDFDKKVTVADARCILRASVGLEKLNNNGSIADAPIVVI